MKYLFMLILFTTLGLEHASDCGWVISITKHEIKLSNQQMVHAIVEIAREESRENQAAILFPAFQPGLKFLFDYMRFFQPGAQFSPG